MDNDRKIEIKTFKDLRIMKDIEINIKRNSTIVERSKKYCVFIFVIKIFTNPW